MATNKFDANNVTNTAEYKKADAFVNLSVKTKSGKLIPLGKTGIALYESLKNDKFFIDQLGAKAPEELKDVEVIITSFKLATSTSSLEDEEI